MEHDDVDVVAGTAVTADSEVVVVASAEVVVVVVVVL